MALELRPNCEICDKDLPPEAQDARICSYECTYCAECAENRLGGVCPNCGGGFAPRPIRPAKELRPGVSRFNQKPSETRKHTRWSDAEIEAFCAPLRSVPPAER